MGYHKGSEQLAVGFKGLVLQRVLKTRVREADGHRMIAPKDRVQVVAVVSMRLAAAACA
jgi:hypothetical protein